MLGLHTTKSVTFEYVFITFVANKLYILSHIRSFSNMKFFLNKETADFLVHPKHLIQKTILKLCVGFSNICGRIVQVKPHFLKGVY